MNYLGNFYQSKENKLFPCDMWVLNCAIKSMSLVRMKFTDTNQESPKYEWLEQHKNVVDTCTLMHAGKQRNTAF